MKRAYLVAQSFSFLLVGGGCSAGVPSAAPRAEATPAEYRARLLDADRLEVRIRDGSGQFARLTIEEGAEPFVEQLQAAERDGALSDVDLGRWPVDVPVCKAACELRYTIDLRGIAQTFRNPQYGLAVGRDLVMPTTSFLLRPDGAAPSGEFVLRFEQGDMRYESGLRQLSDGSFRARLDDLPQAPYGVFTSAPVEQLSAGQGQLRAVLIGPEIALGTEARRSWIREALADVDNYLNGYSVSPLVIVLSDSGDSVSDGYSLGNGGTSVLVGLGRQIPQEELERDWVMTHELLHTTMPSLASRHNWMEEGYATYAEPIARVKRARLTQQRLFSEWYSALWQGQPFPWDGGLDGTQSWGRLYWGGAGFWLAAELAVYRETNGKKTLADCFAAVAHGSRGIADRWSVERFLAVCDAGLGAAVVRPLYEQLSTKPVTLPLAEYFALLGIKKKDEGVEFFAAPLSGCREALFAP